MTHCPPARPDSKGKRASDLPVRVSLGKKNGQELGDLAAEGVSFQKRLSPKALQGSTARFFVKRVFFALVR